MMNQPQNNQQFIPQQQDLVQRRFPQDQYYGRGNPNDPNNPNYENPFSNYMKNRNNQNNNSNNGSFSNEHPYLATMLAMLPYLMGGGSPSIAMPAVAGQTSANMLGKLFDKD